MKQYPTKQDIEKHTKQLVGGLRQYFRGYDKNKDFLKNDFRCLYGDLLLEASNEDVLDNKITINFDVLLQEMVK